MNPPENSPDYKLFTGEKAGDLYTIALPGNVSKTADGGNGYGKFNYLLLMAAVPAGWASVYTSTAMSYVLPSAECDLGLTMFDKGLLNAMAFAGMVCSGFVWGFVADTFGRKSLLVYGYFFDAVFNLASSFSQAAWILILFKFLNGVIISGPFAALMSYLAEIHDEEHRSRTYMWLGVFFSLGNISVPCIAWLIMPQNWHWTFFGGRMEVNSWRMFLILCTIPEFTASIAMSFFPESPRFLISKGRYQEALAVFRRIYSANTGKDPETYPVKNLAEETSIEASGKSLAHKLRCGWRQTKPLFQSPNIYKLILIMAIQFGATLGSNSLRLWMPQLFATIETYECTHELGPGDVYPSVCEMLSSEKVRNHSCTAHANSVTKIHASGCVPVVLDNTVYINSIIIALTAVIGYSMAGSLINAIGKKKLMVFCFVSAAICCGLLYWFDSPNGVLGLSSIFVALASIGGATVVNVIVDNFPTFLRTMAVSTTMMVGRVGALMGNLLFPVLLGVGCLGPFAMIGSACFGCAILVLLLPTKDSNSKKQMDQTQS